MTSLWAVAFASMLGTSPEPFGGMAEKLCIPLGRAQYRQIGVVPRFIRRDGGTERWDGAMGEWLAEAMVEALRDRAQGRFQVVDPQKMSAAFRDLKLKPADLADRAVLARLARRIDGIDALIVGRATDARGPAEAGGRAGQADLTCNLIDIGSGDLVGSAHRELEITPSLAAYRGESALLGDAAFIGASPGSKGANTPNLARSAPLAPSSGPGAGPSPAPDDPRYRVPVTIVVNGKPREYIQAINPGTGLRETFVALEPGESYQVAGRNQAGRTIFGVVYVDGINILGKRRDPDNPRYWNLPTGDDFRFRGWYSGSDGNYQEEPFVVRRASDILAVQRGGDSEAYSERIGEIQCIFFDSEEGPGDGSKALMPGMFGTAAGKARDIKVEEVRGPRRSEAPLLSFVIHYAPMSQIEKRLPLKD